MRTVITAALHNYIRKTIEKMYSSSLHSLDSIFLIICIVCCLYATIPIIAHAKYVCVNMYICIHQRYSCLCARVLFLREHNNQPIRPNRRWKDPPRLLLDPPHMSCGGHAFRPSPRQNRGRRYTTFCKDPEGREEVLQRPTPNTLYTDFQASRRS